MKHLHKILSYQYFTPGNVVRGNQNYANENLTAASGHELQTVDRMSANLLSRYLLISKRENDGQCGSQQFSFLYKTDNKKSWKIKGSAVNLFSCLSQIYLTTPCSGYIKLKIGSLSFHVQPFFFGAEMNAIENHIARFSKI